VPTRGAGEVGQFTANPDQGKAALQKPSDCAVELANRQDFPRKTWLRDRRARLGGAFRSEPIHKAPRRLDFVRNVFDFLEGAFNYLILKDKNFFHEER
jgi:hypothetical protein